MIKLHHLRVGRSVFMAWLLEELKLDYELEIYVRNDMGRAPPELKNPHPLGKSPVIEIDGFTMAESGAIAQYLAAHHDPDNLLKTPDSGDKEQYARWLQWMAYPEASGFAPLLIRLLLSRSPDPKPIVFEMFSGAEVALHMSYIQDSLGDDPYIMGDEFSLPDIGLTYVIHMAERLGELGPYPKLKAYADKNLSRPAFKTAMEKTGG